MITSLATSQNWKQTGKKKTMVIMVFFCVNGDVNWWHLMPLYFLDFDE